MRRIVVGAVWLVLAALLLGGLAAGVGTAQTETTGNGTNASFGAEVSSFMQASEAEAEGELDEEMFDAALNRTRDPTERRALVERRTQRLEERQQELQSQHEALGAEPPNGTANVRAHAVATRVSVGAVGLERAANETAAVAAETGVDTAPLGSIRSNARGLRGPDIEALTPEVAGPPEGTARGPPGGTPGRDRGEANRTADTGSAPSAAGNGSTPNGSGPPAGAGGDSAGSNAGDSRGPPSGAAGGGNGNGDDNDGDPEAPDGSQGNGDGSGPPGNEPPDAAPENSTDVDGGSVEKGRSNPERGGSGGRGR